MLLDLVQSGLSLDLRDETSEDIKKMLFQELLFRVVFIIIGIVIIVGQLYYFFVYFLQLSVSLVLLKH